MKWQMRVVGLAAGMAMGGTAPAAVDVGVSIQISEPGVYGRIDIGRFPQPQVVVAQPVVITPPARPGPRVAPVYLWVPPGHQKQWAKHCARYSACGVPVLFVKEDWYQQHVHPKGNPGKGHGKGHGQGHGNGKPGKD